MDFLKMAKQNMAKNKAAVGETNVADGTNPFLKEKIEEKAKAPIPKNIPSSIPGFKVPGKKPTLNNIPKIDKKEEPKKEEVIKEESKKEELSSSILKVKKDELLEFEPIEEKTVKEEPKEEPKEEESKKEDLKKEEPKKTEDDDKKKTKKKNKKKENINEEEDIEIPTTEISFSDAIATISSSFVDTDWENYKKEVLENLHSIVITEDMNSITCKEVLASLGRIREDVWIQYSETKTLFENLSLEKPEGLIERIKKINSTGANDAERRRNSVLSVMNYKNPDNKVVNLFEILDETRARFNFLKGVMDSIQYKTNTLITYLGNLKLENRQG